MFDPLPSSVCHNLLQTPTTAAQPTQPQGYKTLRKWPPCPQSMNCQRQATHQNPTFHPGARRSSLDTLLALPASTTILILATAPPTRKAVRGKARGGSPPSSCPRRKTRIAGLTPVGSTIVAATAHQTGNIGLTVQTTLWTTATDMAAHQTDARGNTPLITGTAHLIGPPTATNPPTAPGTTPQPEAAAALQIPTAGTPPQTARGDPAMRNPMGRSWRRSPSLLNPPHLHMQVSFGSPQPLTVSRGRPHFRHCAERIVCMGRTASWWKLPLWKDPTRRKACCGM